MGRYTGRGNGRKRQASERSTIDHTYLDQEALAIQTCIGSSRYVWYQKCSPKMLGEILFPENKIKDLERSVELFTCDHVH
ncbi:hypothetical protein TVAGG3_0128560 [Trichomonas vaginalis G3]|uniref:hypothetical protein n=1 Tax=Trichomonas vaginalis (strain ATCC PRA-98 / G3) TaxID=412133 RepID=UPI0021E566F7|nr:hypothetical protein TVAGG3_0128560 [Trichomonas vaginalis G3]KAI5545937.1 hypothetical protein TVAGG3_0128560 [Trichomonas vaginalis G3]